MSLVIYMWLLLAFIPHKWIIHENLHWHICLDVPERQRAPCAYKHPLPPALSQQFGFDFFWTLSLSVTIFEWQFVVESTPSTIPQYLCSKWTAFFFAAEWWRRSAAKDFSQQKEKSSWKDHLGNLYSSLHFARLSTRSPSLMSLSNLFLDREARSLRQFSNTSPGRPNLWQVPHSHFPGWFQLFRKRW